MAFNKVDTSTENGVSSSFYVYELHALIADDK